MFIPEHKLRHFGHASGEDPGAATPLGRSLTQVGRFAVGARGTVLVGAVLLSAVAAWGISMIQINDNPIKWFEPAHPVRVADRVMNEHLAGTYMAYLELEPPQAEVLEPLRAALIDALTRQVEERGESEWGEAAVRIGAIEADSAESLYSEALNVIEAAGAEADDPFVWDDIWLFVDRKRSALELFLQPELLRWVESLQNELLTDEHVGKVIGLPDVVKTVHRELLGGEPSEFRIPDSADTVAQTLLTYQSSHRPQDLWHFVTPDSRAANLWVQLSSGDNRDMEQVIAHVERYISANPPPVALDAEWFGLTYINVVWQDKMVSGMLYSFLGSFIIVLAMMVVLFRSFLWGLLSMIPLTLTVAFIYGVIGLIGKDYDMPVAVLSALSLGLAVDFAIHFLARSRQFHARGGDWNRTARRLFGEPARAISRNVIILGAGFLPLLAAPLVPYQTVGIFIAAIIFAAGAITLVLLPALMSYLQGPLFRRFGKEAES
jgi:predicted RND superfamily exporter protein